mmetsp:Transcript_29406/g.82858  ORF Transcript_29406/g.82858 Transcript_29406/m.82858 type:complete len:242 (-) Transcript_29406:1248-1973(-)
MLPLGDIPSVQPAHWLLAWASPPHLRRRGCVGRRLLLELAVSDLLFDDAHVVVGLDEALERDQGRVHAVANLEGLLFVLVPEDGGGDEVDDAEREADPGEHRGRRHHPRPGLGRHPHGIYGPDGLVRCHGALQVVHRADKLDRLRHRINNAVLVGEGGHEHGRVLVYAELLADAEAARPGDVHPDAELVRQVLLGHEVLPEQALAPGVHELGRRRSGQGDPRRPEAKADADGEEWCEQEHE